MHSILHSMLPNGRFICVFDMRKYRPVSNIYVYTSVPHERLYVYNLVSRGRVIHGPFCILWKMYIGGRDNKECLYVYHFEHHGIFAWVRFICLTFRTSWKICMYTISYLMEDLCVYNIVPHGRFVRALFCISWKIYMNKRGLEKCF